MHPYCPWTPGSSIDYVVMEINGLYHPENMFLDVTNRTVAPLNSKQTVTCVRVPTPEPSIYLCSTLTGEPTPTIDNLSDTGTFPYLINGKWNPLDGSTGWIGESTVLRPYEALLTLNPVVGEKLTLSSQANTYDGPASYIDRKVNNWVFNYQYSTLSKGSWGITPEWNDTFRTGILENYDQRDKWAAYNYVFQKGIGPVNYWKGVIAADNTIVPGTGYEWYAVAWQGQ